MTNVLIVQLLLRLRIQRVRACDRLADDASIN